MNYEEIKNTFIKLKKEELEYIDNISKIIKSNVYDEDMNIAILSWQDKNLIGKKVGKE